MTLSLNLLFFSPLYSPLQSVMRSYWLYFKILYEKADYLLLPPPLPLWTTQRWFFIWIAAEAFIQNLLLLPPALSQLFTPSVLSTATRGILLKMQVRSHNSSAQNPSRLPISPKLKTKTLTMPSGSPLSCLSNTWPSFPATLPLALPRDSDLLPASQTWKTCCWLRTIVKIVPSSWNNLLPEIYLPHSSLPSSLCLNLTFQQGLSWSSFYCNCSCSPLAPWITLTSILLFFFYMQHDYTYSIYFTCLLFLCLLTISLS